MFRWCLGQWFLGMIFFLFVSFGNERGLMFFFFFWWGVCYMVRPGKRALVCFGRPRLGDFLEREW